jgi:hypothetical protein
MSVARIFDVAYCGQQRGGQKLTRVPLQTSGFLYGR